MDRIDGFKLAGEIKRGEHELPDFDVLKAWIQRAPMTWLPALLAQTVTCCVVKGVFQEGGMCSFVERAAAMAADPTSVLRREHDAEMKELDS